MNTEKKPQLPMTLLLLLLCASCGLLLVNTIQKNIQNGGLENIQKKHSEEKKAYERVP